MSGLGDRFTQYNNWTGYVAGFTPATEPEPEPEDFAGLREYADACEALALATAARVEAEARERMAYAIIVEARNLWTLSGRTERHLRYQRAIHRHLDREADVMIARSAECAALARWREVRGG